MKSSATRTKKERREKCRKSRNQIARRSTLPVHTVVLVQSRLRRRRHRRIGRVISGRNTFTISSSPSSGQPQVSGKSCTCGGKWPSTRPMGCRRFEVVSVTWCIRSHHGLEGVEVYMAGSRQFVSTSRHRKKGRGMKTK